MFVPGTGAHNRSAGFGRWFPRHDSVLRRDERPLRYSHPRHGHVQRRSLWLRMVISHVHAV